MNQNIKFVERKDFAGLTNLENLYLEVNDIEFLPEDVFAELVNLKTLGLRDNNIKHFPSEILAGLKNIEVISTSGNPGSTNSINFNATLNVKLRNETENEYYQRGEKYHYWNRTKIQ